MSLPSRSIQGVTLWALFLQACGGCGATPSKELPGSVAQAKQATSKVEVTGDKPHGDAACRACRAKHCANYEGQIDLVAACFVNADPELTKACIAVKSCAYDKGCGYGVMGAPECFCGTADLQTCLTPGAANGPCQEEWFAAARTKVFSELSARFGDVSFPAGVAYHFQACDRDLCKECMPKAK